MIVATPIIARAFLADYCVCVDDDKWAKQVLNGSKEQMDLVLCESGNSPVKVLLCGTPRASRVLAIRGKSSLPTRGTLASVRRACEIEI
jgi:hypothetical protein